MRNPYIPILMRVAKTTVETEDKLLKSFDLEFVNKEDEKTFDYAPGQFCEISVPGVGEAPFGIVTSPTERGILRFTVNKVGVFTTELHNIMEGQEVGLRGPLGNYYPLDRLAGKNVVIIGGGFAFTTLRSLATYIMHPDNRSRFGKLMVVYGARSPGMLLYKEELNQWAERKDLSLYLTVDRGDGEWKGRVGFVPDVVTEAAPSPENTIAVICGPPIMIKLTMPKLLALNFKPAEIYTSLEMRMKCGIGKCGRCNIGDLYVCIDGPVFSYAQLEKLPPEF